MPFAGSYVTGDTAHALTYTVTKRATGAAVDWTAATALKLEYRVRGIQASPNWTEITAAASGTPTDGTLTIYPGNVAGMQPPSGASWRIEFRFKGTDALGTVYYAPDGDADVLEMVTQ